VYGQVGTPEKVKSTAAQLISAIKTRQACLVLGNQRLLQLLNAADVPKAS
jgi:hypothetical protein